jgi:DNA-binding XRE family transcriptional regulator
MLEHTKMHLIEKEAIKTQIKKDVSTLKKFYLKKIDLDDVSFIKELQTEFECLLHSTDIKPIPADEAFQDLTDRYSKAGALLKGVRIREGLTQIEFAKLINTTQANLSSMENGTRSIGKSKAKMIAKQFGVDYRYFL